MRIPRAAYLALSLLALAACEDSTGSGDVWRSPIGFISADGSASVVLPADAGNVNNLPSLTCYTADPDVPESQRFWFAVSSVELPGEDEPLSNCIVEAVDGNPNRLRATLEGETPGWLYQFVVVF